MASPNIDLQSLKREQVRLRTWLAVILILTICVFAVFLSWLAQDSPIGPLVMAKVSMIGLVAVYVVGIVTAMIYARWIRTRREPALRASRDPEHKDRA